MNKDAPLNSSVPPPLGFGAGQMPPPPYAAEGAAPPQPNVVFISPQMFGPEPQRLTCPFCHSDIATTVETEPNSKTHLFALLLCVVGLWCCVPCPYCMDSCMVKKHYCPSCKAFLGQSDN